MVISAQISKHAEKTFILVVVRQAERGLVLRLLQAKRAVEPQLPPPLATSSVLAFSTLERSRAETPRSKRKAVCQS